jgi:protein O-mannosyl-transferase
MLKNKQIPLIYLLLTVAVIIAFRQVNQCDFISYDDPLYVTENTHIMNGVTVDAVRWAFTNTYANFWHPLTMISLMLDDEFFGLNPRWYHLTNLLLHMANTLLLFSVFNRMTKAPWRSAFVAALFALHPLHVESVAWVAERKDVLSSFFWMLTLGAYIHYVEHPRFRSYLAVLTFLALGLMAKPMLVTLPFVLLLLDYWPLQRLQGAGSGKRGAGSENENTSLVAEPLFANKRKGKSSRKLTVQAIVQEEKPADGKYQWASVRPLLIEKMPFFAMAAISSIVTFFVQQKGGAVASLEVIPLGVRMANAFVSYIIYIGKTIWPNNLAVLYPYQGWLPFWHVLGAALLLVAVTTTVILKAKRFPYLAMGWLWFAGTLVPVIGIVQVGQQAMADRYTYVPLIGLFIMAAWGIPELLKNWRYRKEVLAEMSALILTCLFILTWAQAGYWRSNITLFSHALEATSDNYLIQENRGVAYAKLGNYSRAIEDYDRAIEINPKHVDTYNERGAAYAKLGNYSRAIEDYERAIGINPESVLSYVYRGAAYIELANPGQALSDYDRAIGIDPENPDGYANRGAAYDKLGNYRQAVSDFDRAIEINSEYAWAYNGRGASYAKLGNFSQANSDYDKAIEIKPEYAEAHYNRGVLYQGLGNHRQAIEDYSRAIEIKPDYVEAYANRGAAYGVLGNNRQAIVDYDRAIEIDPKYAKAYYNRGVAYDQLGNQIHAISDYDMAIQINHEYAEAYNNRGVAYAKLDNREHAIEDFRTAARLNNEDAKRSLISIGIDW